MPETFDAGNLFKTFNFTKVSFFFNDTPEVLDTGSLLKAVTFVRVAIHFDDA